MKKIYFIFLILILLNPLKGFTFSWEVDFSKMTTKEIKEFYIKNPDYGKNKIKINYKDYIKWEYVVIRGEYYDEKNDPIPNKSVITKLSAKKYYYTTSRDGIFNMEAKKSDIEEKRIYNLSIELENQVIKARITGKKLLKESIFHFKVNKVKEEGKEKFKIENIHNNLFWVNEFKAKIKTKEVPSIIGIQWIWIFILVWIISLGICFFYFLKKKENE